MKQLLIGSEGSLGVISKVSILTPQKSDAVNVCILGFSSFENLLKGFQKARRGLGEILSGDNFSLFNFIIVLWLSDFFSFFFSFKLKKLKKKKIEKISFRILW